MNYVEYDYACKTLENMEYLIRYWFEKWAADHTNDEEMQDAAAI